MTEFDWSLVTTAAEAWMAAHTTAPKYLLLPPRTPKEIVWTAAEIYDTDARVDSVEVPRFSDELPRIDHSAILRGPVVKPWEPTPVTPEEEERRATLRMLARRGELTAQNIAAMSMEDYALVRGILSAQMSQAIAGKSAGEVLGLFKKL